MLSTTTVSPEVLLAQKLAANEVRTRDRAVKRLESFLRARAYSKKDFSEEEMLRIWKGLHYCFWMSDKMLVQEELAKRVSNMVHAFKGASEVNGALLFIKCGLVTLGREWLGIDNWRMDKFMMFVRRFLRQVFVYAASKEWKDLEGLIDMIEETVVCSNRRVSDSGRSLGFQLHFVDIFLEELAKIGGEDLPDEIIRSFLRPFIRELREGKEQRLRSHIVEKIFIHLMRQSDVGIAHDQGEEELLDEEEDGEIGEIEPTEDDFEDNAQDDNVEQDPRAGSVDVTIPQLMVDYGNLAKDLFNAGKDQSVRGVNRKILYKLTKQFRQLNDGIYPLALNLDDESEVKPLKWKKELRKMGTQELQELEKMRSEREQFREAMKQKRKNISTEEPPKKKKKTSKDAGANGSEDLSTNGDQKGLAEDHKKVLAKKKKGLKRTKALPGDKELETPEQEAHKDDDRLTSGKSELEGVTPIVATNGQKKTKSKKKDRMTRLNTSANSSPSPPTDIMTSTKAKAKEAGEESRTSLADTPRIKAVSKAPTPVFVNRVIAKKAACFKTPDGSKGRSPSKMTQSEPVKGKKARKINFLMTKNKFQTVLDHSMSVKESPEIPFVPEKRPKQGVLKNKKDISVITKTPPPSNLKMVQKNTIINSQSNVLSRMRATDFF